ncbi:prenyltransferase/squalene oxidase repeat-containing protein [Nonomuraea mangrovi]|uniref:Prenyltransferase/squalene oxidase repeat-containing protein n=1 Tax=Nonomuraea mangrovi TaxID=2316207 RepID=A0ABW4SMP8_9ACTN
MSDIAFAARELVDGLMARPWGQMTASVYETGRLVTLTPWLAGHAERVDYLLRTQRPDGTWGAPDGYDLVPTLSAVEALLSEHRRSGRAELSAAADRGVEVLQVRLRAAADLPDLPAIELIVPSLVSLINEHLDGASDALPLPSGMNHDLLEAVRGRAASGAELPEKLLHALEIVGPAARGAHVRPTAIGTIGASPAATAAWLAASRSAPAGLQPAEAGTRGTDIHGNASASNVGNAGAGNAAAGHAVVEYAAIGHAGFGAAGRSGDRVSGDRGPVGDVLAVQHLEAVARRHGGPVPVGLPITVFERGWVLSWLTRAGIELDVPPEMVADLRAAIGPAGTPAGTGLPADADTTSVALYALALLGAPQQPDSLLAFDAGTHFCTWQGEDGHSLSVNAHVLDAFGKYVECRPEAEGRYRPAMARLARWLQDRQRPDGGWEDRWHASPYYATAACALALDEYGGPEAKDAVLAAVTWVLDTQREDGSWGRWQGSPEETAYALQVLLQTSAGVDPRLPEAAAAGYVFLRDADLDDQPALWHDKDLYTPQAVVRAAVLAALHVAERDRRVAGLVRS